MQQVRVIDSLSDLKDLLSTATYNLLVSIYVTIVLLLPTTQVQVPGRMLDLASPDFTTQKCCDTTCYAYVPGFFFLKIFLIPFPQMDPPPVLTSGIVTSKRLMEAANTCARSSLLYFLNQHFLSIR